MMQDNTPAAGFAVTLGLPPSVNHQYTRTRGRLVLNDQARLYRDTAAWSVRAAAPLQRPGKTARFAVTVQFRFPDRRRRDLDNPLKILLDAVCAGLDVDDSQIDELHVYRGYDPRAPGVTVSFCWRLAPQLPLPPVPQPAWREKWGGSWPARRETDRG